MNTLPRLRIFIIALLVALVAIFPLRVAMTMVPSIVSARFVGGFVWGGRAVGAQIGGVPLGDLSVALSPLDLIRGQVRLRLEGAVRGALVGGLGSSGIDVETMILPVARPIGGVTITQAELTGARIRYRGGDCAEAEGQAALVLLASQPGLMPGGRFSGPLRCDGALLEAPLVSQSAMDRLNVRFLPGGRYEATLITRAADENAATALRAAGLRETPAGFSIRVNGSF